MHDVYSDVILAFSFELRLFTGNIEFYTSLVVKIVIINQFQFSISHLLDFSRRLPQK